jgi:hypothetical protein
VTASDDGFVRLYAADRFVIPIARFRMESHLPYGVAFSPDGTRVAVCFEDAPKVVVLSGSDLTRLFEADTSGIDDGLLAVGWARQCRCSAGTSPRQKRLKPESLSRLALIRYLRSAKPSGRPVANAHSANAPTLCLRLSHPNGVTKSTASRGFDHDNAERESAWNKDPVFGVIGIQSGPRG